MDFILTPKELDTCMAGVEKLFNKLGCDARPIRQMLGALPHVATKNIQLYLGQVELRLMELVKIFYLQKKEKAEADHRRMSMMGTCAPRTGHLFRELEAIIPPSAGTIEDQEEAAVAADVAPTMPAESMPPTAAPSISVPPTAAPSTITGEEVAQPLTDAELRARAGRVVAYREEKRRQMLAMSMASKYIAASAAASSTLQERHKVERQERIKRRKKK